MKGLPDFLFSEVSSSKRIAIVGVGNELCGDDAAGMYFADLLFKKASSAGISPERLLVLRGSTAPENHTGAIRKFAPELLFFVDAAFMETTPGSVALLPENMIDGLSFSTHMLPLTMTIDYLRLDLRCKIYVIGIQLASTEQGVPMSDAVKKSASLLADYFVDAIKK